MTIEIDKLEGGRRLENVEVSAINRDKRLALVARIGEKPQPYPIVTLFDSDGDETDDMADAVGGLIKVHEACWVPIMFSDFADDTPMH